MSDTEKGYAPGTIVPNALLPKIGRIAALYTQLDMQLNRTIWDLMSVPIVVGRVVTGNIINFSTRLNIFASLANIKFPNDSTRIAEIRDQIKYASEDRNRLIHDEPHMAHDRGPYFSVRRGELNTPDLKVYVFDKPTLDDLTNRLLALPPYLGWIMNDFKRWRTEQLPSLDKSPTRLLELSRQTPSNPDKPKAPRLSSHQRREQALARQPKNPSKS